MNLKQTLVRKLWGALSPNQQRAMVYEFLDWLYADLPPEQRVEKANRLAPRLMAWIAEGEIGLSLVVYQHLKCLPLISTMSRRTGRPLLTPD